MLDQNPTSGTRYITLMRERDERRVLMIVAIASAMFGAIWATYFFASDRSAAAISPMVRIVISLFTVIAIWRSYGTKMAKHALMLCGIVSPFVAQSMIGGLGPSGFYMLWSLPMLVVAVNVQSGLVRYGYLVLTGGLFVCFALLDPGSSTEHLVVDNRTLFAFNIGISMAANFVLADLMLRSQRKLRKAMFKIKSDSEKRLQNTVEERNRDLQQSLDYASRIQMALWPTREQLADLFEDVQVLYRPKEAVGGDLLWHARVEERSFFLLMDCTGHGVPGSLMSVMMHGLLNEAVRAGKGMKVSQMLRLTQQLLHDRLDRDRTGSTDNAEMAMLCFDHSKRELTCCNMGCGFIVQQDGKMERIKSYGTSALLGNLGGSILLTDHVIPVNSATRIHIYTDGVVDQFCTNDRQKFTQARLQRTLEETAELPVKDQMAQFVETFETWSGTTEQVDDILMVSLVPAAKWYTPKMEDVESAAA